MRGDVEDAWIVVEGILGAIAVVHIEVDDGDALEPVALARVPGGDGDVVQQAEAHRLGRAGVMAGRAHGAEGGGNVSGEHRVGGGEAGACRLPGGVERAGAEKGVHIDPPAAFLAGTTQPGDEFRWVHQGEFFVGGLSRFDTLQPVEEAALAQ